MIRGTALFVAALLAGTSALAAPRWSSEDLTQLAETVAGTDQEGLSADTGPTLEGMMPGPAADDAADAVALGLARDFFEGSARIRSDPTWHLPRSGVDYRAWLDTVLARHSVRASYRSLLPASPAYVALKAAFAKCSEARGSCTTLARNLDRLRALPRTLGRTYIWVNVPAYRLDVIRDGEIVESHKVIVGKPKTQTPTFRATVIGVTVNPWWNVPCSIVDESIGKLIRTNPAEAARRGFVASKGADGKLIVRQKPGPQNALGRIKLEMPNPYGVYIHDTPSRDLFANDKRAFSHGCIRTEDPQGLATGLLGKDQAMQIGILLTSNVSRTIPLKAPLPVYVVYFTAELDPRSGTIMSHPDIYYRDGN
jgi:murein L,D-transpeptidase YcbB/YkuD